MGLTKKPKVPRDTGKAREKADTEIDVEDTTEDLMTKTTITADIMSTQGMAIMDTEVDTVTDTTVITAADWPRSSLSLSHSSLPSTCGTSKPIGPPYRSSLISRPRRKRQLKLQLQSSKLQVQSTTHSLKTSKPSTKLSNQQEVLQLTISNEKLNLKTN